MKVSLAFLALMASVSALRISKAPPGLNTQKRYPQHDPSGGGPSQLRKTDAPSYATRYQGSGEPWSNGGSSRPSAYVPTFGASEIYAQRQARRFAPSDDIPYGSNANSYMNAAIESAPAFPSEQGNSELDEYAPTFGASERYVQRQARRFALPDEASYGNSANTYMNAGRESRKQASFNSSYVSSSDSGDDEFQSPYQPQSYQPQPSSPPPPSKSGNFTQSTTSPSRQYGSSSKAPTRPFRSRQAY